MAAQQRCDGDADVLICEPIGDGVPDWAVVLRVKRSTASVLELRLVPGTTASAPTAVDIAAAPVQSCIGEGTAPEHPILPYHAASLQVLSAVFKSAPSVLCLGLGLGELPRAILSTWPAAKVVGIDVSSVVVQLAKDLAASTGVQGLQAEQADAVLGVEAGVFQAADVVVVDMGAPEGQALKAPPKQCLTVDWLRAVQALVLPEGVLLVNVLCGTADCDGPMAELLAGLQGTGWEVNPFDLSGGGDYPAERNVLVVAARRALPELATCTTGLGCAVRMVKRITKNVS